MKIGFDNDKYLKMQSEHIRERINQFGNKLYLEFGGKLFDDYHASRVLPGFEPDSKLRMLMQLSDQAEIVIVISAADIDKIKSEVTLVSLMMKMYSALWKYLPSADSMSEVSASPSIPDRKAQMRLRNVWRSLESKYTCFI